MARLFTEVCAMFALNTVQMQEHRGGIDPDTASRISATNADLKACTQKYLLYFM